MYLVPAKFDGPPSKSGNLDHTKTIFDREGDDSAGFPTAALITGIYPIYTTLKITDPRDEFSESIFSETRKLALERAR